MKLYHGTSCSNAISILKNGFDFNKVGSNYGTTYGKGIYFTPNYETARFYAGENGLVISKIQKGKPVAVSKAAALASGKKKKKTKEKTSKKNVAYYKIPVTFEISGNFIGYIKFKRAISLSNKMLNFDKETIKVVKGNTTGTIKVSGTLTIVGLADDFS